MENVGGRSKYDKGQTIELPNKDQSMVMWLSKRKRYGTNVTIYFLEIIICWS